VPQLLVYNKCDLLEASRQPREEADFIEVRSGVRRQRVFVSARTGQGLPRLRQAIAEVALAHLNATGSPPSGNLVSAASPQAAEAAPAPNPHQHA